MPNLKSAIKRAKSDVRKTQVNKTRKSSVRTQIRKADAAIENGEDNTAEILRETQKRIDQAAARGTISKNTAARSKARLNRAHKRSQSEQA